MKPLLLPTFALLTACNTVKPAREEHFTVMKPGEVIAFSHPNGGGTIRWDGPCLRTYTVDGESFTVRLEQRPSEFNHQRGIYSPAEHATRSATQSRRFVVQESVVDFADMDEMTAFLRQGGEVVKWVSDGRGRVLGYDQEPGRNQVGVSLFQFQLKGKPLTRVPTRYPGTIVTLKAWP